LPLVPLLPLPLAAHRMIRICHRLISMPNHNPRACFLRGRLIGTTPDLHELHHGGALFGLPFARWWEETSYLYLYLYCRMIQSPSGKREERESLCCWRLLVSRGAQGQMEEAPSPPGLGVGPGMAILTVEGHRTTVFFSFLYFPFRPLLNIHFSSS
jgi:hypothetical protein